MPCLELTSLVEIACRLSTINEQNPSNERVVFGKFLPEILSNSGTSREKTHYAVSCSRVCLSYRIPSFFCLTESPVFFLTAKKQVSLRCLRKNPKSFVAEQ